MIIRNQIYKYLTKYLWLRRAEIKSFHQRHVSLGDLVFGRTETAEFLGFGPGSTCYNNTLVIGSVSVGSSTWVGPNVVLDGSGGLEIGSNCAISAGVQIYSHHTVERTTMSDAESVERSPTRIGNNVYIGPNSVVQMGVSIGDGAVIGALTLVNKDVPPGVRIYGSSDGKPHA